MAKHNNEERHAEAQSNYSDQLSPTDGYFTQRDMPQHYYAAHNSATSADGDAKLIDVPSSSQVDSTGPSASIHNASHFHSDRETDSMDSPSESTPLLFTDQAPPPPYSSADIEGNGRLEEPLLLLSPTREPEIMGVAEDAEHFARFTDDDGSFQRQRTRPWYQLSCSEFFILLGVMLFAFFVVAGTMWSILKKHAHNGVSRDGCVPLSNNYLESTFDSLSSFSLTEDIDTTRIRASIDGSIRFLPAPSDQKGVIAVRITASGDQPAGPISLVACRASQSVVIKDGDTSDTIKSTQSRHIRSNKITVHVTAYIKSGLSLNSLNIQSVHLHHIHSGISQLSVKGTTSIYSTTGSISLAQSLQLSSRKTQVTATTNTISGDFWLKDELILKTTTGAINARVHPMEASSHIPKQAKFSATSTTGSIDVTFPIDSLPQRSHQLFAEWYLPDRDYDVRVESTTGAISGKYPIGSSTIIDNKAGINADFKPFDASKPSFLTTTTTTGSSNVRLLPSYKDEKHVLGKLRSTHDSITGSISLRYPKTWEGNIVGSTTTGSLTVVGPGVRVIKQTGLLGDSSIGHSIEAEKGDGDSSLRVKAQTGSVDIIFAA